MTSPFHLAFAINAGYAAPLKVLWASLFAHHAPGELVFHVLHDGISAELEDELRGTAEARAVECRMHAVDAARTRDLPVNDGFPSPVQFHRLDLPEYIPPGVERVLYLDTDMLVCRPLGPLLERDLGGRPLGAVEDLDAAASIRRLGLPEGGGYFNSGMLLMDPAAWARDGVAERVRAYLAAHRNDPAQWRYPDQDSLNAALAGNWTPLPPEWDLFVWLRMFPPANLSHAQRTALLHPGILHFTGPEKPWRPRHAPPYQRTYLQAARQAGVTFPGFRSPAAWWARRPAERKLALQRRIHAAAGLGEDF